MIETDGKYTLYIIEQNLGLYKIKKKIIIILFKQ